MVDFERTVLSRIHFGNFPDEPSAAWFAACEALAGGGYVKSGKLTQKGVDAITQKRQSDG